jgi:hypothetical protein
LLDGERRSLAAELRPWWRLKGRYEDLSLVMMLARLERECLSQPGSRLEGGLHPQGDGDQLGHRLADWANPWGAAPRMKLDIDLGRVDAALKRLGRWLSKRTVAKAQSRAHERLESITADLEARDLRALAAATRPLAAVTMARDFDRAARARVAAVGALLSLAAGAGAFLLVSAMDGGPGDSVGGRGAVEARQHPAALDAQVKRGPARPRRDAGQSASPLAHPKAQGGGRRRSQGGGHSAPVVAETPPPAPEPAAVSASAVAPSPAPAPAPPNSQPGSTPSQAKDAGGPGSCPPEFGYEC